MNKIIENGQYKVVCSKCGHILTLVLLDGVLVPGECHSCDSQIDYIFTPEDGTRIIAQIDE